MSKVELVKGFVTELKSSHKYVIGLDNTKITAEDAYQLGEAINGIGIENVVVVMFRGDPSNGMKVIEQRSDSSKPS